MASLSNDPGGRRRILFMGSDGKRKPIRLGKMPLNQARVIQRHVERLVACRIDGSAPPEETSRWLVGVDPSLREKLAKHGLTSAGATRELTLGQLIEDYKGRSSWKALKPNTVRNNLRAFEVLLEYFYSDTPLSGITAASAGDFYAALGLPKEKGGFGFAVATRNTTASVAHALFAYAIDAEIIHRNPFRALPRSPRKGNNAMVSEADSLTMLNAMLTSEEKLLFALARWGGFRTPSEPYGLRWCDVDWERQRFLVHSPKTERHEGHATRWVPIFPELAPLFDEVYFDPAGHDEYVLPSIQFGHRCKASWVIKAAFRKAGIDQWPRPWHSLRSTRQTELENQFPSHVVCAWLGNSEAVARKHYLQVTEDHFEKAAQNAAQHVAKPRETEPKCPAKEKQKTT